MRLSLLILLGLQLTDGESAPLPVIGTPVPELTALDDAMTSLMEENEISAGSLSVMRDGAVIFHHTYGWQDREKSIPLRPDAVFRIASVTKPITAAAIRKLISQGKLSLDSKVFSLNGSAGALTYTPFGTPDERLGDVTIDHLLQHQGGWDQSTTGDYTRDETEIAEEMGVPSPPSREEIARYVMGKPLQFTPGSDDEYSNYGYMLLGLVIEAASGQSYYDYIDEHVIGPIGANSEDWLIGRSFAVHQDEREPFYDDPELGSNVFYPAHSDSKLVEDPYGSFNLEARVSQGAIVTGGVLLLQFLENHQVSGAEIGGPRPGPGSWRRTFFGSLSGTNALARQRGDGFNFVVLLNKRGPSSTTYTRSIRDQIDAIIDSGTEDWPSHDLVLVSPQIPHISISRSGSLGFKSIEGRFYQWHISHDLKEWRNYRSPRVGDGTTFQEPAIDTNGARTGFFRLRVD